MFILTTNNNKKKEYKDKKMVSNNLILINKITNINYHQKFIIIIFNMKKLHQIRII